MSSSTRVVLVVVASNHPLVACPGPPLPHARGAPPRYVDDTSGGRKCGFAKLILQSMMERTWRRSPSSSSSLVLVPSTAIHRPPHEIAATGAGRRVSRRRRDHRSITVVMILASNK